MTEYFSYKAEPNRVTPMTAPSPIWPDFDSQSQYAQKLIRAKQVNDSTYWTSLRDVLNHDCDTLPLERFKVWASVWNVPLMSNSRHSSYIRIALNCLAQDPIFARALQEPIVGLTADDFQQHFTMFSDFPTTMNRIQHLSHLMICGYTPEYLAGIDTIVELGGGIGDMADIVYKLGFKGEYIIYDFPEVGRIQKWYHTALGLDKVSHTSDLSDLGKADLVIGTWSFTEMPIDLRAQVLEKIGDSTDWLLAYSKLIFGIDNEQYITETFVPQFPQHTIEFIDIPFMPWDGGTKYLTMKIK